MPFLFKLAQRVARLRSRPLLVAAAVVAGACAKEVASPPAGGTPPVTIDLSATDAAPGGSVAAQLRATEPLAAIQETVAFDPQRLRYERPGDGPDLVVVNDEAAAQGSLRVLATSPQSLAPAGVTLVFTVIANGYAEGVRGTVELAVAPDGGLVWGAAPPVGQQVRVCLEKPDEPAPHACGAEADRAQNRARGQLPRPDGRGARHHFVVWTSQHTTAS